VLFVPVAVRCISEVKFQFVIYLLLLYMNKFTAVGNLFGFHSVRPSKARKQKVMNKKKK
jgi:hypothetical protein